jgi:hypothetical protein
MIKFWTVVFGVFALAMSFLLFGFMQNYSVKQVVYNETSLTEINTLAYNVSVAHEYHRGVYDCTQYAKELKAKLRSRGYNAYCVFGYILIDGKSRHDWVMIKNGRQEIFVEATPDNIGIIPEQYYKQYYKEITRGVCK